MGAFAETANVIYWVYHFMTKENKYPFLVSVSSIQSEVTLFHLFWNYICKYNIVHIHIHILYKYIYIYCRFKQKTEAQKFFLGLFTVCSSYKGKIVICPFVDKETTRSYRLVNRLNGLNELAHLCYYVLGIFNTLFRYV
jgi:hypothetical protein